jgi:short-subunit dehydrogenase
VAPLIYLTGASSGLGQALALHYYGKGYRLALAVRRVAETRAWATTLDWDLRRFEVYEADVADIASIVGAGQRCIALQGIPDVVFGCAGFSAGMDTSESSDLDMMARMFATNNVGLAATFHPFIALMQQRGNGALVGIASVHGIRGMPGHGAYCASKAGVVSYCESLRGELRSSGVKVVTICPGYIDTPLTKGNSYSMPFLMQAADFAREVDAAIAVSASYRVIPWQMGVVAKFLRVLPNGLFDRLFAGRPRKPRISSTN